MLNQVELFKKLTKSNDVIESSVNVSFDEKQKNIPLLIGDYYDGKHVIMGCFAYNNGKWVEFGYPG